MLFIAACAFLFHSSVTDAASRGTLHVSLLVMATGAVVWVLMRRR
jgi:hypothetical protein